MELRNYLKITKKYLPLTIGLTLVSVLAVLVWRLPQAPQFQARATFYVNRVPEPRNSTFYTFEGYYAMLVSKDYTDVEVGLLKSTDIRNLAVTKAGVGENSGINIKVKKMSPQLIEVAVASKSAADARKVLVSLAAVALPDKSLLKNDNQGVEVTLVNPEPVVEPQSSNLYLYLAIAVVGSLLISLLFAATREYFLG